jgi:hypothetical protein
LKALTRRAQALANATGKRFKVYSYNAGRFAEPEFVGKMKRNPSPRYKTTWMAGHSKNEKAFSTKTAAIDFAENMAASYSVVTVRDGAKTIWRARDYGFA